MIFVYVPDSTGDAGTVAPTQEALMLPNTQYFVVTPEMTFTGTFIRGNDTAYDFQVNGDPVTIFASTIISVRVV